jgi:hypothetical protein
MALVQSGCVAQPSLSRKRRRIGCLARRQGTGRMADLPRSLRDWHDARNKQAAHLTLIKPLMSFQTVPRYTSFNRSNHGFVVVVFAIVVLLHVFALSALRESPSVKTTAARPKAAPLIIRIIPPETRSISTAPDDKNAPSTNAGSKSHLPKPRSPKTAMDAPKPIAKEHATSATIEHKPLVAHPVPMGAPNAHAGEASAPNVDWQGDLKRLGSGRTARYRQASPFAPSHAETPSEAPASPLSRGVSEAARQDCRKAHDRHGLLAIPMLMYDAANESGCKW